MPKCPYGEVGYSEETARKHAQFADLCRMHVAIVDSVWRRHRWARRPYRYIDITPGPGMCSELPGDASKTSPVLFAEAAADVGAPYCMDLIERTGCCCDALRRTFRDRETVRVWDGNHNDLLLGACETVTDGQLGLLYVDPSGNVLPYATLAEVSELRGMRRVDFLFYVAAANHKRGPAGKPRLVECLDTIDKQHWVVRRPTTQFQWTFILGSNWMSFPAWQKRGFYSIKSDEGRRIIEQLNYTERERSERPAEGQLTLPVLS